MVAYNFQRQFVEPIQAGAKSHTIRKNGKRRHARAGEALQLYFGLRTKSARKIIDDPVCVFVKSIRIIVTRVNIEAIDVDGCRQSDMEAFARCDGFQDLAAMHAFWLDFHGVGIFEGSMIGWER